MTTLSYSFTVSKREYRRLQYFHTFQMRRWQSWFVALAWLGALALAIANIFMGVEMTNVMQMCYIAVGASVPLLVVACEINVKRYCDAGMDERERTLSLSDEWVKFRIAGNPESEKATWEQLAYAYDLDEGLVIFRDAGKMALLPWRVVPKEDVDVLCGWCESHLGRAFKRRRRAS